MLSIDSHIDDFAHAAQSQPYFWHVGMWTVKITFSIVVVLVAMNLLIAVMSHTFEKVQEEATVEWRVRFIELVKEHMASPPVPPPFSIMYRAFQLSSKCCDCCRPRRWRVRVSACTSWACGCNKNRVGVKEASDQEEETDSDWHDGTAGVWGAHLRPSQRYQMVLHLDGARRKVFAPDETTYESSNV